ncbi:MAG: hypothetical protein ACSHW7_08120 [Patiriisocius sp.]|uniref:hypothetical protein n=1 Tax=Patiriisocius sp. TaxID=2822396 RepID=UPI003EF286CB
MEDNKNKKKKSRWAPTIVSIIIGIIFTALATWYTIYTTKEEAQNAQRERLSKVKDNLVSIIEEHIVNKDSLDLISFERLIANRSKEENLLRKPNVYNLLSQAEYNIESSKHLSFEKKKEYSVIISSLYNSISTDTLINFSQSPYQTEISKIISSFSDTENVEGKKALSLLIESYENEVLDSQGDDLKKESFFQTLFKSPTKLIAIISIYIVAMFVYYYIMVLKRRRRKLKRDLSRRMEQIKRERDRLSEKLSSEELSNEERQIIEKEIEFLYEEYMSMGKTYYRQQSI